MNDLKKKVASAIAAGTLLLNLATPAFATSLTLEVSGNGSDSDNEVELEYEQEVTVTQTNVANVLNDVKVEAETGGNEAEDNTGGDVEIETGDAEANVTVSNTLNSNVAHVDACCLGDVTAKISGNGSDSDNEIELELENEVEVTQANEANVWNYVKVEAETGDNEAEDNTGGPVEISTGDATVDVTVDNLVNFNWADIDGCGCLEDILAKISGNGAASDNEIEAELESELEVTQANDFDCKFTDKDACAKVDAELSTGDNEAEGNTQGGEDPTIETGDANADVEVNNSGNSNVFGDVPDPELEWPWGFDFNFNFSFDLEDLLA